MNLIYIHGLIALGAFVPLFLSGGFGVELPLIGWGQLDTTYESTPLVCFVMNLCAAFLVGLGLQEIRGKMSGSTFMYYHWALSGAVLLWQMASTTTIIGKLLFTAAHVFTVASTLVSYGFIRI